MRIHYTMGALRINEKAQCLKEGKTIPGLCAAGEITGGIHGRNRIGGNGLAHYTMGALRINEKAQCLKEGKTIPGLCAAGEITGGIHGRNRIGGNGLADAFTFGMIAAENLVSES